MATPTFPKPWPQARLVLAVALLIFGLFVGTNDTAFGTHLTGVPASYTLDADFDEGTLVNVNHNAPNNDQLQLDSQATPFAFIWVAVSTKGTAVKIDTATGTVLGEYGTAPDNRPTNPSRTTVDGNGNAWVGNRD